MPASPKRSERLRGRRLGAYEVGAPLGHGPTAAVFEAVHVALGKPVAIKVLNEHLAADAETRARFVREGRLAAGLSHPHIAGVLDVGLGEETYLVMERVEGVDLATWLRERGPLPLEEALSLLLPVASALAYAHRRGVVHRDLKPSTVFVARDRRGGPLPKIVDFGLSKSAIAGGDAPVTSPDSVVETPEYMAPEQTYGERRVDARADQYALAAIVYEALAGRRAVTAASFDALVEAVRGGAIPRLAEATPPGAPAARFPAAIDAAVMRALSVDPKARFPDVPAFARELLPWAAPHAVAQWEPDFAPSAPIVQAAPPVQATPPAAPSTDAIGPAEAETRFDAQTSEVRLSIACDPGASPFHIKGIAYRGLVHLVEQRMPGGVEAFATALRDERLAAFLRQPFMAASPYDIFPIAAFSAAAARQFGMSLVAFAREQGAAQARYDLRSVYRSIFDALTPDNAHVYIARFDARYYDFGSCSCTRAGPRHLVLHRKGLPAALLPWFAPMHAAYGQEILRAKGMPDVECEPRAPTGAGERGGFKLVDFDTDMHWGAP